MNGWKDGVNVVVGLTRLTDIKQPGARIYLADFEDCTDMTDGNLCRCYR